MGVRVRETSEETGLDIVHLAARPAKHADMRSIAIGEDQPWRGGDGTHSLPLPQRRSAAHGRAKRPIRQSPAGGNGARVPPKSVAPQVWERAGRGRAGSQPRSV